MLGPGGEVVELLVRDGESVSRLPPPAPRAAA
jgi:hypothetical protein